MNLEPPEATVEFAEVIARVLGGDRAPVGDELYAVLDGLGVLDLAAGDSVDAHDAQVNVVTALEAIAAAGARGPVAETIWARGRGLSVGGFVGAASGADLDGHRLVAYGAWATALLAGSGEQATTMPVPDLPVARTEIDPDHRWLPAGVDAPSLTTMDRGYAWRTAAATTLGAMSRAASMATTHARDRVQFGRALASFQALQFRLAECHWRLAGLRLLVREAAWRADRQDGRADVLAALAWLYAREVGQIVSKHAHQVHGAIGFTRELGLTTVTGSAAVLRALHPAAPAVAVVRAGRGWDGTTPPSTVLGGFRTGASG
jgi:hypothetical protein